MLVCLSNGTVQLLVVSYKHSTMNNEAVVFESLKTNVVWLHVQEVIISSLGSVLNY